MLRVLRFPLQKVPNHNHEQNDILKYRVLDSWKSYWYVRIKPSILYVAVLVNAAGIIGDIKVEG
jgi:hypothetical protein